MRITMNIAFTVGREDLATLVLPFTCDKPCEPFTRGALLLLMRERLKCRGPFSCGSRDDYSDNDIAGAEAIVDGLFPELIPNRKKEQLK